MQKRGVLAAERIRAFRRTVRAHYRAQGRHDLPWRHTTDPYKILVSEMMLQQTQVSRVIEKYREFLGLFPTVHVLARAELSDVLRAWSGLGYNRRAKYLHDAARVVDGTYRGSVRDALCSGTLPGVGPYTAAAVRTFAFNESHPMLETNIRTVLIHHFFPENVDVHDRELKPLIETVSKGQSPREWYWALMDYGAHLKRSGVHNNAKSAHYTKQSRFKGSLREVRGAILRAITSEERVLDLPFPKDQIEEAISALKREGLIATLR